MTVTAEPSQEWLDKVLRYRFSDPLLLKSALTHRSGRGENNERLEFLGDALLGYLVADALYRQFPDATEGELTRRRAQLVRRATLAEVAKSIGLGEQLNLGSGELKSGGYRRSSILADALEALFAAVYLDGGLAPLREIVDRLFRQRMLDASIEELKDSKTRLQEHLQSSGMALPGYEVVQVIGEAHEQTFKVCCKVGDLDIERTGTGSSRRRAEQDAASQLLAALEQ